MTFNDETTENLYQDGYPVLRQSLKGLEGAEIEKQKRKLSGTIQLGKQDSSEKVTALHQKGQTLTPSSLTAMADSKALWIQET